VIVVLMWFVLAYTALKFIQPLFIEKCGISSLWRLLLKSGVCALYMTAMDFFIDPLGTRAGLWFWKEPGGYFDTPWANFGGWFLVGWTICSVYLFFERPATPVRSATVRRLDGLFPPISIFLTILCFIGSFVHLRSVLPVMLSLAILGPCWWFWLASTRPRQPQ
jgi:uncharacterized membrane protein